MQLEGKIRIGAAIGSQLSDSTIYFIAAADGDRTATGIGSVLLVFPVFAALANEDIFTGNSFDNISFFKHFWLAFSFFYRLCICPVVSVNSMTALGTV